MRGATGGERVGTAALPREDGSGIMAPSPGLYYLTRGRHARTVGRKPEGFRGFWLKSHATKI